MNGNKTEINIISFGYEGCFTKNKLKLADFETIPGLNKIDFRNGSLIFLHASQYYSPEHINGLCRNPWLLDDNVGDEAVKNFISWQSKFVCLLYPPSSYAITLLFLYDRFIEPLENIENQSPEWLSQITSQPNLLYPGVTVQMVEYGGGLSWGMGGRLRNPISPSPTSKEKPLNLASGVSIGATIGAGIGLLTAAIVLGVFTAGVGPLILGSARPKTPHFLIASILLFISMVF